MPGLLDVALQTETVRGVTITGISAKGVAYLMARYPEMRALMGGRAVELTAEAIMNLAPDALAAVIACGCGQVPDGTDEGAKKQTAAEAKVGTFPVGVQAEFIVPILRVTMPGGVGPFVASLETLSEYAAEGLGKVAATNSPKE